MTDQGVHPLPGTHGNKSLIPPQGIGGGHSNQKPITQKVTGWRKKRNSWPAGTPRWKVRGYASQEAFKKSSRRNKKAWKRRRQLTDPNYSARLAKAKRYWRWAKDRKKRLVLSKRSYIRHHYKTTLSEIHRMFKQQGNSCGICHRPLLLFDSLTAIDHCHKNGHVRGILCLVCNMTLGKYETGWGQWEGLAKEYLHGK